MIKESRYHSLNKIEYKAGHVLYWMNRDMRLEDNWALLYAQERALELGVPLMVVYNLDPHFLGGTLRQYDFKVGILKELEVACKEKNISFQVLFGSDTEKQIVSFIEKENIGFLVTDFSPLKVQRAWLEYIVSNIEIPAVRVDAHNIVPVWIASQKIEVGARTLRPKLHKLLPSYLEDFPNVKKHPFASKIFSIDWDSIESVDVDRSIKNTQFSPNPKEAKNILKNFLTNKLGNYASKRNDPNESSQSDLSPYLHYGVISAQRVVLEVCKLLEKDIQDILPAQKNASKVDLKREPNLLESASALIEELVVRRELADNFCFYNLNYDNISGFPTWAQNSLAKHIKDKREYIYTQSQLEKGETHDDAWNAAQKEMLETGKMHGYMRMYWAKKILEWTDNAEQAMKIAIYLNDKYEIDGRDPNGYAGIAWSIGGVHDRAWFERPIFGLVRYMARSGLEKKFDVDAYIKKWIK